MSEPSTAEMLALFVAGTLGGWHNRPDYYCENDLWMVTDLCDLILRGETPASRPFDVWALQREPEHAELRKQLAAGQHLANYSKCEGDE